MSYFEVLVEGNSDVPVLREILVRKFGLQEKLQFRIHPHKGRGKLPANPLSHPDPRQQTLLNQLPSKLRGFAHLQDIACVLVVVDVDDTPCTTMLADLNAMLEKLPNRATRVLFRLAIEETESWFLADEKALKMAFPKARTQKLKSLEPDEIVGAWEILADVLGIDRKSVTGADKYHWATLIAPWLDLDPPKSPSLRKLLEGIEREIRSYPASPV